MINTVEDAYKELRAAVNAYDAAAGGPSFW
jgi:hypothetical protein